MIKNNTINYQNFCVNGEITDLKFSNMIKSVIEFVDRQLMAYQKSVDSRKQKMYNNTHASLMRDLERWPHYYYVSKWTMLNNLSSLIYDFPVRAPMIRKRVSDYFDTQLKLYCYGERPYTNQIQNYPYKSTNIVDLLEEVEQVRKERFAVGLSRQHYRGE